LHSYGSFKCVRTVRCDDDGSVGLFSFENSLTAVRVDIKASKSINNDFRNIALRSISGTKHALIKQIFILL